MSFGQKEVLLALIEMFPHIFSRSITFLTILPLRLWLAVVSACFRLFLDQHVDVQCCYEIVPISLFYYCLSSVYSGLMTSLN